MTEHTHRYFYGSEQRWPQRLKFADLGVRLPTALKKGMEQLTGLDLSQVKVHYQSIMPNLVLAHGYAQGDQIYLAQGQERHLPHELGHVVQQKWGMVQATTQVNGIAVNDDPRLEQHATQLGNMALALQLAPFNSLLKKGSFANKKHLMQLPDDQSRESIVTP